MTTRTDSFDSRILKWGGAVVVAFVVASFAVSADSAAPTDTAALVNTPPAAIATPSAPLSADPV